MVIYIYFFCTDEPKGALALFSIATRYEISESYRVMSNLYLKLIEMSESVTDPIKITKTKIFSTTLMVTIKNPNFKL